MHPKVRTVDEILARLASSSYGIVTRAEMLQAGISEEQIKTRVRRGTLLREHRGVFSVGHRAPTREATYRGGQGLRRGRRAQWPGGSAPPGDPQGTGAGARSDVAHPRSRAR